MTEPDGPFCEIVTGRLPATVVRSWSNALAIIPLKLVVEGPRPTS